MVFIVALSIVQQNSVVNSIVFVNYCTIVSLDNPSMAFMITKLFTTHVVEYVQILSKLPVVFAKIRPPKPKKKKIKFVHVFGSAFGFGFGAYVKALIEFKAFYFFGSVSVRFRCVCEMALIVSACRHQ